MLLQASADQYRRQQHLTAVVLRDVRRAWKRLDFTNLDESWPRFAALGLPTLTAGQHAAAQGAVAHVERSLAEQNHEVDPDGEVNPAALAGVASDGRPLDSLLYQPVVAIKGAIGRGADQRTAMTAGAFSLDRIIVTQMMDAARTAAGIGVTIRQGVGYIRELNPPSCARCAILAGKWYRWSADFNRHTSCDCGQTPATPNTARDLLTDPAKAVDAGQVTGLSGAEQAAFDEGADLAQLVNVHRQGGIYSVRGKQFTREGTTVRGYYGRLTRSDGVHRVTGEQYRRTNTPRITPAQIYAEAGGDRNEAVRLLRRFGYLD